MQSNIWQIVPIIDGYIYLIQQQDSWLQLMQDGAGHASQNTIHDLAKCGIYPISWPAFSPNLNPIEMVQNWMKDWIQECYPEDDAL